MHAWPHKQVSFLSISAFPPLQTILEKLKKKVVTKVGYELQHGLWGKAFLALTPDPIWSLTPPEFISRPCLPESRGRHVNVDHVTLCTFTMVTCAPSEPVTHQRCHHRRRCCCSTSLFRIRHYLAGNIRMFTITRCPDSTPTTPIKGSTKKLVFFRNDS